MRKINVVQIVEESKFNSFHLKLLVLCCFIVLCDGFDMSVYGSIVTTLSAEWGLTASQAGLIGSVTMIGSLIGALTAGIFADKWGRKIVILICFTIFGVFTLLTGFAQGPTDFGIYRFIAGLGLGGLPALLQVLTFEYSPKTKKTLMIGLFSIGFSIGGIIVALSGMKIIPSLGWEWMFYLGGIPLLALPFLIKYLPESLSYLVIKGENQKVKTLLARVNPKYVSNQDDIFEVNLPNTGNPVPKLFEEKRGISTISFWAASFVIYILVYGLSTWLPKLMVTAGYPLQNSLLFLFALNLGGIVGTIGGGWLCDRIGNKQVLIGMFVIGGLSLAILGFKPGAIAMYLLVAVAGACTTGAGNANNGYTSKFYPTHIRTTGVGWGTGVGRFGAIFGPTLGGVLLDANLSTNMNFIAVALPAILGVLAISFVQTRYSAFNKMILDHPKNIVTESVK